MLFRQKAISGCGIGRMHHPDHPLSKGVLPQLWDSRQPPAFSSFRVCLGCGESFQPRSCPSQGRLHPVINYGEDVKVQPLLTHSKTTMMGVWSWACGTLSEPLTGWQQILFLLCLILFPPLPSTVLISNQYLVPTLHLSWYLLPKIPACNTWFRK